MGNAIVTLRVMPESPEVDLKILEKKAVAEIEKFAGKGEMKIVVEPVAFGLKSLNITFVMDENIGTTDPLEEKIAAIKKVNSVEVTDVRRAIG